EIIFAAKRNIPYRIIKGTQPKYKCGYESKDEKRRTILHT
ncbi:1024_t:CDS:1, partial [Gigaspora rosea]